MNSNSLFLRLFGISVCCLVGIVAREAIVGGNTVTNNDFRYQASILIANQPRVCGGAIHKDTVVLTAAHCIVGRNGQLRSRPISVVVGTHNLNVSGQIVEVNKIFIPREYKPHIPHSIGDIAVLLLKTPLDILTLNLKMLRLPNRRIIDPLFTNKAARIAGFGWDRIYADDERDGINTDYQLRFADATVLSVRECQHDHPTLNLTEKHLCARVKQYPNIRRGVCVGDGGGALAINTGMRGEHPAIGILSVIPHGCSERSNSGIYTRLSHYLDFIKIAVENIQTSDMLVEHP